MIYSFVWTDGNAETLERSVPLTWHARHLRRHGWANGIAVVFLEGYSLLPENYIATLSSLGYEVIDASELVMREIRKYPGIEAVGRTPMYWFLRWNVLGELRRRYQEDPTTIHIDGDCIFVAPPIEVSRDVRNKTFMLQGCPAFVAISSDEWFGVYAEELMHLVRDRGAYVREAMTVKNSPARPSREYCNALLYNADWFQDQDLLEYLIASGKIPQDTATTVFDSEFFWIQNPLFPGEWFEEQQTQGVDGRRLVSQDEKGFFYVGTKRIPFFHHQTTFSTLGRYYLLLNDLKMEFLGRYLKPDRISAQPKSTGRSLVLLLRLLGKLNPSRFRLPYEGRLNTIERLLPSDGSPGPMTKLLNRIF